MNGKGWRSFWGSLSASSHADAACPNRAEIKIGLGFRTDSVILASSPDLHLTAGPEPEPGRFPEPKTAWKRGESRGSRAAPVPLGPDVLNDPWTKNVSKEEQLPGVKRNPPDPRAPPAGLRPLYPEPRGFRFLMGFRPWARAEVLQVLHVHLETWRAVTWRTWRAAQVFSRSTGRAGRGSAEILEDRNLLDSQKRASLFWVFHKQEIKSIHIEQVFNWRKFFLTLTKRLNTLSFLSFYISSPLVFESDFQIRVHFGSKLDCDCLLICFPVWLQNPFSFPEIDRIQKGETKKETETYLDLFTTKNIKLKERVLIPVKQYPKVRLLPLVFWPLTSCSLTWFGLVWFNPAAVPCTQSQGLLECQIPPLSCNLKALGCN